MRRTLIGLGLGLAALSGCRTNGPAGPRAGATGLAVVIDQPAAGGPGLARVDDRRWLDLPAAGTIDLAGVAAELELDSLVLEATARPGGLRVLRCALLDHAEALTSGWLLGREVSVVTARGAEVAGTVVELGKPVAVVGFATGEVPYARDAVTPVIPIGGGAPTVGSKVSVDTPAGPQIGELRSLVVDNLVIHDRAGTRHAVRFDAITRLRVPELAATPTLRCQVRTSRPGRQAVRLAYRTAAARWDVGYQLGTVDDRTTSIALVPRYRVDLAGLRGGDAGGSAEVALRVVPSGDDAAPVAVWSGPVALAGEAVTVVGAPSMRPARVRRWFRGVDLVDEERDPRDRRWGQGSTAEVWRELVFERAATDVPGELRVAIAGDENARRWITGALLPAPAGGAKLVRVPLDVDPRLIGFRERVVHDEEVGVADEIRLSVANRGDAPVRVVLEEPLRPIGRAAVRFAAPAVGTLSAAYWQLEVDVAPGGLERAAVFIQYPDE